MVQYVLSILIVPFTGEGTAYDHMLGLKFKPRSLGSGPALFLLPSMLPEALRRNQSAGMVQMTPESAAGALRRGGPKGSRSTGLRLESLILCQTKGIFVEHLLIVSTY